MKTVKTTLIVIATLFCTEFVIMLGMSIYDAQEEIDIQNETLSAEIDLNIKLDELGKKYINKTVTINSWDNQSLEYLEVPVWYTYKSTQMSSLQHGDKVTLLEVINYDPSGSHVKIETETGQDGYITYWYIDEFKEAKDIDPLLNLNTEY